jgi:hypothetical protein
LYKHRPLARYRAFILKNANSALANMNSPTQFSGNWSARDGVVDFIRQTSGVDLLNAANSVPSQASYNSLRQLLLNSDISLPASVRQFTNGVGSLRSVMMVA